MHWIGHTYLTPLVPPLVDVVHILCIEVSTLAVCVEGCDSISFQFSKFVILIFYYFVQKLCGVGISLVSVGMLFLFADSRARYECTNVRNIV